MQRGRSIREYEIINMFCKGQIEKVEKGAVRKRVKFMHQNFGITV